MYSGYNSLKETIQRDIESQKSVLNKFPESISRPITQSCSKYLAQFTSYQLPFKSDTHHSSSATGQPSTAAKFFLDPAAESASAAAANSAGLPLVSTTTHLNHYNHHHNHHHPHSGHVAQAVGGSAVTTTATGVVISSNSNSNTSDAADKVNIIQLDTVEQVNWTLENLMYGLTLSHDFQDTIKDCWNVYHDWLCVLLDEPRQAAFLPAPIRDDPVGYSRKMLWHLYHLFVPRAGLVQAVPTKHIMMCHGVLILIEGIAKDSRLLQRDLWEDFLKFFLAINDAVLAPPFGKDDFGEILSSRIVATLFEIWLIACTRAFPSPSLWKTFQELCAHWRHHISLVVEWNRVCYALTNRLLELTWWPESSSAGSSGSTSGAQASHAPPPQPPANSDTNVSYDIQTIIRQMTTDTVIQSWYRFWHVIGRPVDFSDHLAISKHLDMLARSTSQAWVMNKKFN
jgi:hypothetical protein